MFSVYMWSHGGDVQIDTVYYGTVKGNKVKVSGSLQT